MRVPKQGSDAISAHTTQDTEKHYRLLSVGKNRVPDLSGPSSRGEKFWVTVATIGGNLASLEK
jgi:hypothetical protein